MVSDPDDEQEEQPPPAAAQTLQVSHPESTGESADCTRESPGQSVINQEATQGQSLTKEFARLSLGEETVLVCDAGYGFPSEARPRKEKILAVAKQLFNFLQWQVSQQDKQKKLASVRVVVSSKEDDKEALEARLKELWVTEELPDHVEFLNADDFSFEGVYLSPDAINVMSPSLRPPPVVIVGMLIDRRVQPNRSLNRSNKLGITSARWPLEACAGSVHPNEPLNVDVVLEGMQQWWWNVNETSGTDSIGNSAFTQAATQALQRHYQRHPNRPLHKNEKV